MKKEQSMKKVFMLTESAEVSRETYDGLVKLSNGSTITFVDSGEKKTFGGLGDILILTEEHCA